MTEHELMELLFSRVYAPFIASIIIMIRVFWMFRKSDLERGEKMNTQLKEQIKEEKDELNKTINDKFELLIGHSSKQTDLLTAMNEKLTIERIASAKDDQRLTELEDIVKRRRVDRQ